MNVEQIQQGDRAVIKQVTHDLVKLGQEWDSSDWKEVDWSKVRDLQFQELLESRNKAGAAITECACRSCPEFITHVSS